MNSEGSDKKVQRDESSDRSTESQRGRRGRGKRVRHLDQRKVSTDRETEQKTPGGTQAAAGDLLRAHIDSTLSPGLAPTARTPPISFPLPLVGWRMPSLDIVRNCSPVCLRVLLETVYPLTLHPCNSAGFLYSMLYLQYHASLFFFKKIATRSFENRFRLPAKIKTCLDLYVTSGQCLWQRQHFGSGPSRKVRGRL